MRRMITSKQQEFVENLGKQIEVDENSVTIMTARGSVEVKNNIKDDLILELQPVNKGLGWINNVDHIESKDSYSAFSMNDNQITLLGGFDDDNGDTITSITMGSEGVEINPDLCETGERYLKIVNLPTSDPKVEGAVWNDNGVLKISAGA